MALQVKRTKPKRTFPPPKAAAPQRGRRKHILEKVAAAEKAEKKKQAKAARARLKAIEKKHAEQLAARQAALKAARKAAVLPLLIARDGVIEFAKAVYRFGVGLGKKVIAAAKLTAGVIRAMLRHLDPRPAIKYAGRVIQAIVAWLPRLNPLPYLARAFAVARAQAGALLMRGKKLAQATFSTLADWAAHFSGYLQPRQLLTYSYAAAIGASLVVVGGQIALQVAEDTKERIAAEEMASYQAANDVPAETAVATAILQADKLSLASTGALTINRAPELPIGSKSAVGVSKAGPSEQRVRSAAVTPTAKPAPGPQPDYATDYAYTPAVKPAPKSDYSTAYPFTPAQPVIAVVIDDMGMVQGELERFARLPAAVTFAFLPYSPNLEYQTRVMRDNGHEMIVHLPMEPKRRTANPGPQALLTRLSDGELRQRIAWNLGRFEGFSGINNHMGSLFTEDPRVMRAVMTALKARGLYFLDSMTTARSVGIPLATEFGVPRAQRDIFLDNKRDYNSILRQLQKAERIAERRGHVIAIGHPHRITYQVLHDWVPTLQRKGIRLVTLSALIERPAPVMKVAENSAVTELPREMPMDGGGAVALSGSTGMR